jgi:hypothetical protein
MCAVCGGARESGYDARQVDVRLCAMRNVCTRQLHGQGGVSADRREGHRRGRRGSGVPSSSSSSLGGLAHGVSGSSITMVADLAASLVARLPSSLLVPEGTQVREWQSPQAPLGRTRHEMPAWRLASCISPTAAPQPCCSLCEALSQLAGGPASVIFGPSPPAGCAAGGRAVVDGCQLGLDARFHLLKGRPRNTECGGRLVVDGDGVGPAPVGVCCTG